jgi:hypothetical protein
LESPIGTDKHAEVSIALPARDLGEHVSWSLKGEKEGKDSWALVTQHLVQTLPPGKDRPSAINQGLTGA